MYLVEKIACEIGTKAKLVLNVDDNEKEIIIYGAINLLQTIFAILYVVIAGALLGILYEALIFSFVVGILRKYSGGVHATSPGRCNLIGTITAVLAGIVVNKWMYRLALLNVAVISIICMTISFIILLKNAPVDSIKKPITNMKMKKSLKIKSIATAGIFSLLIMIFIKICLTSPKYYYIEAAECISLGVLWQCITLTKAGISVFGKFDFALKSIMKGGEI